MSKSSKFVTAEELKNLYPGLSLLEGYDEALIGVVASEGGSFIPVYDTFAVIDVIYNMGFESKEDIKSYFFNLINDSKKDGIGPMFIQSARLSTKKSKGHNKSPKPPISFDSKDTEIFSEEENKILEEALDSLEDMDTEDSVWHDEDDSDFGAYVAEEDLDPPFGYKYTDSAAYDSDSDSDSDESFKVDSVDSYEYGEDEDEEEDEEEDENKEYESLLELEVYLGNSDPYACILSKNKKDIMQAIRLFFPNLENLRDIKRIHFLFDGAEMEEDEDNNQEEN
jgi:hypothetical protein